jgi:hypothetical protein
VIHVYVIDDQGYTNKAAIVTTGRGYRVEGVGIALYNALSLLAIDHQRTVNACEILVDTRNKTVRWTFADGRSITG